MPRTHIDIHHVARLARIALTADEAEAFGADLDRIVHYFESLQELALTPEEEAGEDGPPLPLRPDVSGAPLSRERALEGAPQHDGSAFIVPKVV